MEWQFILLMLAAVLLCILDVLRIMREDNGDN